MREVISATLDARDYTTSDTTIDNAVAYLNSLLKYDGYEIIQDNLMYVVERIENGNSSGIKNLIFASNGPKPEIVLEDATTNDIKIVKNAEFCLVYNRKLNRNGLLWTELVDWWANLNSLQAQTFSMQANRLYLRLLESVSKNEAEKLLFNTYYHTFQSIYKDNLPALIPQVYLHYDPKTLAELKGKKRLVRQRMDFLLLLPKATKIVIEIDGKQHFAENDKASPKLYAEMVAEDRRLKINGYEVFRFGGYEFTNKNEAREKVIEFFKQLLNVYITDRR